MTDLVKCIKIRFVRIGKRMKPMWIPVSEYDVHSQGTPRITKVYDRIKRFENMLYNELGCRPYMANPEYSFLFTWYLNNAERAVVKSREFDRPRFPGVLFYDLSPAEIADNKRKKVSDKNRYDSMKIGYYFTTETQMIPRSQLKSLDDAIRDIIFYAVSDNLSDTISTTFGSVILDQIIGNMREYANAHPIDRDMEFECRATRVASDLIKEYTKELRPRLRLKICYLYFIWAMQMSDEPVDIFWRTAKILLKNDTDFGNPNVPPLHFIPYEVALAFFSKYNENMFPKELRDIVHKYKTTWTYESDEDFESRMRGYFNGCTTAASKQG